uniref:Phosphoprotein n=1 Tax=Maize mosaic virus TaxID=279896 RepID=A0A4P8XEV1_MMV|nr:phosphoprotein [Maize mosaic nucleorhabdovirus]
MNRYSRRSRHPNPPVPNQEEPERDPNHIDQDLADLAQPLVLKERHAVMAPTQPSLSDVINEERQAPITFGNPPEVMANARLSALGYDNLTEREKRILAVGIRCGEAAKDYHSLTTTKKWIEDELKSQMVALASSTRTLTEAASLHTTFAMLHSPSIKRKAEAMSHISQGEESIDISKLNKTGMEDIWVAMESESKEDAVDTYLRNILEVDPTQFYAIDGWGLYLDFIPTWHYIAAGKNSAQFKTSYADEIVEQRAAFERVLSKRPRVEI